MLDLSTFEYDQQAPLGVEILSERMHNGAIVPDITYASPRGGKVSAYLILPSKEPPRAGSIFGHWGEGNRTEFVDEAIVLARLGFASLCLDAPHRRPAEYEPQRTQPHTEVQWVVDARRGADILQETCLLAPGRIGYVGHSYGATFGGVVAGVEHRISAFVLMAGWYALSELARTSTVPVLAEARSKIPPEVFAIYMDAMEPLDARHYIGHAAPSHLFFQFAYDDSDVLIRDGERYFELVSQPKQIAVYDNCGHALNAKARVERGTWLCAQFGLPEPSQEKLKLLEQVPTPVPLES
jgi:hypothetical protein